MDLKELIERLNDVNWQDIEERPAEAKSLMEQAAAALEDKKDAADVAIALNLQYLKELEQVKRERDALLEYAKEQHECEMCENDTFCPHMAPTFEDCSLCNLECPCYLACEENDNWQWRGPKKEE